jgi:hypothetical protein
VSWVELIDINLVDNLLIDVALIATLHKTGIKALRECLQELLGQIADKAFPKLRSEIRRKLTEKQEELASLGLPCQTGRQQQQFLVSAASKFQNIVRAALDADY